jgi:hypothetical protein
MQVKHAIVNQQNGIGPPRVCEMPDQIIGQTQVIRNRTQEPDAKHTELFLAMKEGYPGFFDKRAANGLYFHIGAVCLKLSNDTGTMHISGCITGAYKESFEAHKARKVMCH